ncbi:MAG: sodium:solute symporter family protein [Emcibacteraceae bacterium]|nr:sodium:solute symporter family protein [Emcibacteraceae bacterium]
MDIYTTTIAISIIVFVLVGNYAGRKVKKLDDYFVAGRRAPTLLIVGTLVASLFSSTIFMGEAGFTYAGQLGPYMLFPSLAVIGYIYGALFFGTYLRRSRAPTVAEYFGRRFNSHKVQQAAGLTIIVALGCYLLVVTQGAAILLSDLTSLTYNQSLIIAWLSYTVFTMYSGSEGILLTDTMMFLLFTFATILVIFVVLGDLGGVSNIIEGLTKIESKPDLASWHGTIGPGTDWLTEFDFFIWIVFIDGLCWSVAYAIGPWQSGRHLMAKDEHVVLRSSIYAAMIIVFLQFFVYGLGGIVNIVNPDITPVETVIIWAAKNMVPEMLGALLLAGIMAAALSSASTFLSLVGFSVSNDIIKREEPLTLKTTRIIMMVIGIIILGASFVFPANIFWLMIFIGTVFTSTWGVVAFMSIWSKTITAAAAFWGMAAGFSFNVVPSSLVYFDYLTLPSYFNPALIGIAASLIVTIAVTKSTKVSRAEAVYRMRMHRAPAADRDPVKVKKTLFAPKLHMLFGVMMPFLLLYFYVIPYQRGTGELLSDGSINWATFEAILPIGWAIVHIPLAITSYIIIRKRYGKGAKVRGEIIG